MRFYLQTRSFLLFSFSYAVVSPLSLLIVVEATVATWVSTETVAMASACSVLVESMGTPVQHPIQVDKVTTKNNVLV